MSSEVEKAISGFSIIAEQVHIKEKTEEYINSMMVMELLWGGIT